MERAAIEDIVTEHFNRIIDTLTREGWRRSREYDGFDAWIDYGKLFLDRDGVELLFEWDNWFEGRIEGPRAHIEELAKRFGPFRGGGR